MLIFDKEILIQKLVLLSDQERLGFALLICERLKPLLEQFSATTRFDFSFYRNCLDAAWGVLNHGSGQLTRVRFCRLEQECLERAPDTENFSHELTSAALNCALSIGYVMGFICNAKIENVVEIAQLSYDTVDMYVQAREQHDFVGLESNRLIVEHEMVQAELNKQLQQIEYIRGARSVVSLQKLAREQESG